jgi:hypothetical protein
VLENLDILRLYIQNIAIQTFDDAAVSADGQLATLRADGPLVLIRG